MMKVSGELSDELYKRACCAAAHYPSKARKPIVIEFAGVPKAGKTSNIGEAQKFFQRCGFRVEVVAERASLCPIRDKKHQNFNVWTACATLSHLLEKTQTPPRDDDPQILFLDRGIFDAVCWMHLMSKVFERLDSKQFKNIINFLLLKEWRKTISAVILMTTSPEKAMERERGVLLPPRASLGSIMDSAVLGNIKKTVDAVANKYDGRFNIHRIDTSESRYDCLSKSVVRVVDIVLGCVERQTEENILHLEHERVRSFFGKVARISSESAGKLVAAFQKEEKYTPRKNVEGDDNQVQALPIVVVRDKSGRFLRLKRREVSPEDPLHGKNVLWAGGHVREEDDKNGDPILQCALRELREELRISAGEEDLKLMGAIHIRSDNNPKTGKHVAIVYEWQAKSDSVGIVLSGAEFFEGPGNAMKEGEFLPFSQLSETEDWSAEIIKLYADNHPGLI